MSLIAHYKFNDDGVFLKPTVCLDDVGNHNGVYTFYTDENTLGQLRPGGPHGTCMTMRNRANYIGAFANDMDFRLQDGMAVAAWVCSPSVTPNQEIKIMSHMGPSGGAQADNMAWNFRMFPLQLYLEWEHDNGVLDSYSVANAAYFGLVNHWYHVAAIRSVSGVDRIVQLMLNGSVIGTSGAMTAPNGGGNGVTQIGKTNRDSWGAGEGAVASVRVWDDDGGVPTPTEIQTIYNDELTLMRNIPVMHMGTRGYEIDERADSGYVVE